MQLSGDFSTAGALKNHFFHLHEQNKSGSKTKFKQAHNHYKKVLEAAKLNYANKTKNSNILETWVWLWEIANIILCKGKSDAPSPLNDLRSCLLQLIRQS